ncbi:MAG: hypothetical protein ACHQIM_19725, partial [Sphingobacteriales bacterium]
RMLLRSDKRLNAPTPAESRVYRSEKWKIQAPEEPPWDFNVLKAISLSSPVCIDLFFYIYF